MDEIKNITEPLVKGSHSWSMLHNLPYGAEDISLCKKLCHDLQEKFNRSYVMRKDCGNLAPVVELRTFLPMEDAIYRLAGCLAAVNESEHLEITYKMQEDFGNLELDKANDMLLEPLFEDIIASNANHNGLRLCIEAIDHLKLTYEEVLHKNRVIINRINYNFYTDQSIKQDLQDLSDLMFAIFQRNKAWLDSCKECYEVFSLAKMKSANNRSVDEEKLYNLLNKAA